MFARFRKEQTFVARVLDSPMKIIIAPQLLTIPVPDDETKILFIYGNFKHISDADAFLKARTALDKLGYK